MIKQVRMYTVVCDNCGIHFKDNDNIVAWTDEASALQLAKDSEWDFIENDHYCPDCPRIED